MSHEMSNTERAPLTGAMKPFGTVHVNGMELDIGMSLDAKRVVAVANGIDLTLFLVVDRVNSQGRKYFELVPDQRNAEVAKLCRQDPNYGRIADLISQQLQSSEEPVGNEKSTNERNTRIEVPPGRFDSPQGNT